MQKRNKNNVRMERLEQAVRERKFNRDSNIWCVHIMNSPAGVPRTYGFAKEGKDRFFSDFMGLSLTRTIDSMRFDRTDNVRDGDINFVNFYIRELDPGEETNITAELLDAIGRGWENEPTRRDRT